MLLQSGELWCTKFVFKLLCIVPIQLAPSSSLSAWLVKLYMCASIQCQYQYGYLQACYVLEDLWLFLVLLVCSTESREETAGCLRRAADNWWISNPRKLGSMPGGGLGWLKLPSFWGSSYPIILLYIDFYIQIFAFMHLTTSQPPTLSNFPVPLHCSVYGMEDLQKDSGAICVHVHNHHACSVPAPAVYTALWWLMWDY